MQACSKQLVYQNLFPQVFDVSTESDGNVRIRGGVREVYQEEISFHTCGKAQFDTSRIVFLFTLPSYRLI